MRNGFCLVEIGITSSRPLASMKFRFDIPAGYPYRVNSDYYSFYSEMLLISIVRGPGCKHPDASGHCTLTSLSQQWYWQIGWMIREKVLNGKR